LVHFCMNLSHNSRSHRNITILWKYLCIHSHFSSWVAIGSIHILGPVLLWADPGPVIYT